MATTNVILIVVILIVWNKRHFFACMVRISFIFLSDRGDVGLVCFPFARLPGGSLEG